MTIHCFPIKHLSTIYNRNDVHLNDNETSYMHIVASLVGAYLSESFSTRATLCKRDKITILQCGDKLPFALLSVTRATSNLTMALLMKKPVRILRDKGSTVLSV